MEQYTLLCLDCHEIFPGRENHSCKRNVKNHLTARVDRVNGKVTRLDGSSISKSSIYENRTHSQSAISATSQETLSDRMRMTVKPTCQTFIEQKAAVRFFPVGDFRHGLFEFEPEKPKRNLNVWPILQDDGYDHCTPREVCISHFQRVSDDLLMDINISLASPENMGASAGASNGWDLIDRYELLDAEAHRRPEDGRFVCPICGRLANRKAHFFAHYRTHTGEKPYACEMCEKKFSQKHVLVAHRWTHTGEKPYSCDMCDHKCSIKSHLERHRKTHMGGKKHICTICGKSFASASSLNNLYKNYHSEK